MTSKNLIFSSILVLCCIFYGTTQNSFEVLEAPLSHNRMASSFTINIIGYNQAVVMQEWQDYTAQFGGVTYLKSDYRGVIDTETKHAIVPLIHQENVTIGTKISPNDTLTGVLLSIWMQKDDGCYVSSKEDVEEAKTIKSWLFNFQNTINRLRLRVGNK